MEQYTTYCYKYNFYNSKWAAVHAAHLDGLNAEQIYSNIDIYLGGTKSFFGNLDTTIEPTDSWGTLLKDRVHYLRDTLPSINLCFSGGHDSYFMLKTFLNNNIPIDKIIIERYIPRIDPELNYEQTNVALELLKLLDIGKAEVIVSDWNDISTWVDSALNETSYFESGLQLFPNLGDVAYRLTSERNVNGEPMIRGSVHPRVYYKDGRWRSHMWDSDNWGGAYTNPNFIPFYTDSRFPKIHLKQLHLTKNYLEKHNIRNITEREDNIEYKHCYVNAVRSATPEVIFTTPFEMMSLDDDSSHLLFKNLYQHMTKKKEKFFLTLAKERKNDFEKLYNIFNTKLGGLPMMFHKSFLRIYDVPLD